MKRSTSRSSKYIQPHLPSSIFHHPILPLLEQLIHFDQQLLLALNGSDSLYWDSFFMLVTKTLPWIPMAAILLFLVARDGGWRRWLVFALSFALVIFIADRFSSGFCKPFFHRFRPTHEPALEGLVDIVGDYTGGLYGFISSHAANTFGLATFLSLVLSQRSDVLTLFCWASLSSYSRIYLGLHYPGDILCGALWGALTGIFCFWLYQQALSLVCPSSPSEHRESGFTGAVILPIAFVITCIILLLIPLF